MYLCIMKTLLLLLLLLVATVARGQSNRPWEEALYSLMTAEDMESADWEDTYDMLCQLEEDKINLNTASREQLEALPFLSDSQVEGIMEYLYRYGAMKSLGELRMIDALDYPQIELLRHFTYVEEERSEQWPGLEAFAKNGRHEAMGNLRVPLYKRRGDDDGYLGYPLRHWLRYQYSHKDYVKAGIVASQDAGEPFFTNRNKTGYDFYSFYLQAKRWKRIENIVVGRYRLATGMGLVLNNSFSLGKLAMLQQLGRSTTTVRPHSSRSQTAFMQGAAATVSLSPRWQLTAFASYRPLDATLNDDASIRTIVADGYHRTTTEMDKKNNSHATDGGTHVSYRWQGWHAGLTAVYTHLDRDLRPDVATLYRRHWAQGNDFLNVSADYGLLRPRLAINGETAINRQGAVATINSLSLHPADGLNIMLLQRFYSYRYTALYARTVSEGGRVQNESAIYGGLTWQPHPTLRLQLYTDYAYFAWARYQVSQSSWAWDNMLTATYSRGPWTLAARYRLHLRQKDNAAKTALDTHAEQRGRLALTWQGRQPTSTTTQADAMTTGDGQRGYMVSQAAATQWRKLKLSLNAGYFHTDSYAARLYVYERSPLYSFTFPSYYGEGIRCAIMVQGNIGRRLTLTAKCGMTHYIDRSTIGSGLQQIDSPTQTDMEVQARWRLNTH